MGVGIVVVAPLRVENGHGGRQFFVRHVVVANDEIDAQFFGVGNLFNCLDAAVEHDDEAHATFGRKIHPLFRYTISLFVAIGNVVVDVGIVLTDELIDQSHRCHAVHIVVAIDHDALFPKKGAVESFHRCLHVVHEEGVEQLCELWAEETSGLTGGKDAALTQHLPKDGVNTQFVGQMGGFCDFLGGLRFVVPLVNHCISCFCYREREGSTSCRMKDEVEFSRLRYVFFLR